MPLRIRLVLILVLLVAVALAAIEAITYSTIQTSLISTVDSQMKSSVGAWQEYFQTCEEGRCNLSLQAFDGVQPDTFGKAYNLNGTALTFPTFPGSQSSAGNPAERCSVCDQSNPPPIPVPVLSRRFIRSAAAGNGTDEWGTAAGTLGVHSYRVLTTVVQEPPRFNSPAGSTYVLVVAFPLTATNSTLRHILALELVIGACILVAVAVVSWFFVRLGLRPLEHMARTASEIAAGDLTKRVDDTDERTEVGQLGASLNVMLTRIERAFRERAASEERLRRFVGDASHELRTPLTSIRGYAELFKTGVAERPEDLASALGRIESESSRMAGLVDDLLLLARLDQGRPLGHDPVDLTQLALDAVRDASVVDPSRQIRMISTGPCVVIGDDQRLHQVLGNLISNAIAYSPPDASIEVAVHMDRAPAAEAVPAGLTGLPGLQALSGRVGRSSRSARALGHEPTAGHEPLGPDDLVDIAASETSVWTERELGRLGAVVPATSNGATGSPSEINPWPGTRASVAVIDHGPGIPMESWPHVFERFWRADPSRKRTSGGSGLGLAIVAAVVTAHGGVVTIRETPGGGATFVVELPAAPEMGNGSGSGEGAPG